MKGVGVDNELVDVDYYFMWVWCFDVSERSMFVELFVLRFFSDVCLKNFIVSEIVIWIRDLYVIYVKKIFCFNFIFLLDLELDVVEFGLMVYELMS